MITGLCCLMFATRRQLSMLTLIGSVVLTRLIVEMIQIYTKNNGLKEFEEAFKHIGVVISLVVLIGIMGYDNIKPRLDDKFVDSKSYPVEACDYILENIDLSTAKFYNEYNYGSYMLFRGIPVFIDSRADLYSPEFNSGVNVFEDSESVGSFEMDIDEFVEKYNITHIILSNQSQLNKVLKKIEGTKYKLVKEDENFSFYKIENL